MFENSSIRIRGMIFDLDGTLGDTLPVCFEAFRKTFQRYLGRRFDDREIRAMFGPSEEGVLRKALPDVWTEALETYLREYERAHVNCQVPFAGIESVLKMLQARGVRLAIVTGKGRRSAEISARVLGLNDYFHIMETGSHDRPVKPEGIRAVLAGWLLSPSDVAYVGDAPSDIVAAKQEGLLALAAAWAETAEEERLRQLGPYAMFRTVESFAVWVDKHVEGIE